MRFINLTCLSIFFILISISIVYAENFPITQTIKKAGLVQIYYEAVNNNADIAAARAQYQAKKEVVPQAKAGLLPQITAGANVGDVRTALDKPPATVKRNSHVYEINLTQPLFHVDRWFQLQAAYAMSDQARLDFTVKQQHLILQSAHIYFNILQAEDNLAATKAEEKAYSRQADESLERFRLGLADRTDYLQAKAAYDMAKANRIESEKAVADSYQALTALIDKKYDAVYGMRHNLPINPPKPNSAKSWVDKAIENNISLKANFYAVTAAQQTLKQKKAGHAPTLDLVTSYKKGENDAFNFQNTSSTINRYGADVEQRSIGIQLQIPIYSGGMTSSQVREAHSTLMMSEQQQEGLRRQVVQNTRNYHRAINTDVAKIIALRQTIISSQSALEATEMGFRIGTRNIVDVLDAQRQLYDAVRNYNNARYAYIIDSLSLKEMVGSLSPLDLQELEVYLNPNYNPEKDFLPISLMPHDKLP